MKKQIFKFSRMKKSVIIIFLIFFSYCAQSQITFGPKIGFTASKLTSDKEILKNDFKNSLHYGVFLRLGNKLHLQPELLYMTKGASIKYNLTNGIEQNIKLNTIDIPLMLGVKLINLWLLNVRIYGGPVASFVINKDITHTSDLIDVLPQKENIKDLLWSMNIGAGVDLKMFTLDIRYEFGMSDIIQDKKFPNFDITDVRNNAFLLSLGIKIF